MSGSSWREGANARREKRQTAGSDAHATRGVPNKRDTKRWCKGKVGVDHKLVVKTRADIGKDHGLPTSFKDWLIRHCEICGKEVAWWFPMGGMKREPPEWVVEYKKTLGV
jgi:hypothetical protein